MGFINNKKILTVVRTAYLNVLDVYPIGAIYMSVNNTNPATLFGGTWEQLKDTFLLAAGDSYAAGTTGGEATHTLTINEMPSHNHKVGVGGNTYSGGYPLQQTSGDYDKTENGNFLINYEGGDQPHNNMPPYLTVYMWKRTA